MSQNIGFLVWCPEHGFPTYQHETFLGAVAEAERLKRLHPQRRFVVMSPVERMSDVGYASGFSDGKKEGLTQAHREIMKAEANADRWSDEAHELRKLKPIMARAQAFQSIVADCLCWFAGYRAGSAGDGYGAVWTPSRDTLQELNQHLQSLLPSAMDDEIPF